MRRSVQLPAAVMFSLALLLATSGICLAHRDRVLPIRKDGRIAGLPAAYSPARLDIHFTTGMHGEKRIDAFRIRIGAHETSLPACVTGLLATRDPGHVQALGSTLHDPGFTTLYLNFYGPDFNRKTIFNNYVTLAFNLRSAKLAAVTRHVVGPVTVPSLVVTTDKDGRTTVRTGDPKITLDKSLSYDPVDVGALCPHVDVHRFMQRGAGSK
jgi:hypothetical protein